VNQGEVRVDGTSLVNRSVHLKCLRQSIIVDAVDILTM